VVVVLASLGRDRGGEQPPAGRGHLDRRWLRPPPRLHEAEPPEDAGDEADPDTPEPAPLLLALLALLMMVRGAGHHLAAGSTTEQVRRWLRDSRHRTGGSPGDVPGRARLCLPDERHRAGLRPVIPERQVAGAGALLGEEPLVELTVLIDAQRALRKDDAAGRGARWRRRRLLVVGHGRRHLSGTDATGEGSEHSCVPVWYPAGGKDARIVLYNGSCSVVGRHFSYIRTLS
jgi:hypothetical protein